MTEITFQGIPRNLIPWNPTIDYEKCTSCGKCAEFCKRGVFTFQADKKRTTVKNPNNCKVYCKNCQKQCPTNAITHPSEEETTQYIKNLQNGQA
jgi:NAD-dependent dihydropyrimidine dehydrogenase PreA subunit